MKPYKIIHPRKAANGIVYNCPHSGTYLPDDFREMSAVEVDDLLASGDTLVDRLMAHRAGSPLFINMYARSYVDTNREAYELDPRMFSGNIDQKLNQTDKVNRGFGTLARCAYNGKVIHKEKIPFSTAQKRLEEAYFPVHEALQSLLDQTYVREGYVLLVDCHSMPSHEFLGTASYMEAQADIVLGNHHGKSCCEAVTDYVIDFFAGKGLKVMLNKPYAGGYNTVHYGAPETGRHSLQIEMNRALYLDEKTRLPNDSFDRLQQTMTQFTQALDRDIADLI